MSTSGCQVALVLACTVVRSASGQWVPPLFPCVSLEHSNAARCEFCYDSSPECSCVQLNPGEWPQEFDCRPVTRVQCTRFNVLVPGLSKPVGELTYCRFEKPCQSFVFCNEHAPPLNCPDYGLQWSGVGGVVTKWSASVEICEDPK